MMLRAKWAAAFEAAKERLSREQENIDPHRRGVFFWLVCKGLYPVDVRMEKDGDKCSECRSSWWDFGPAFAHAHGLPHFVNWCVEHPAEVRERFPEAVMVTTETILRKRTEVCS